MIKILSSPLQGYTDFRFRNAFQKYFGGVDQYIAPYIRLSGKKEIKAANERDVLPKNNTSLDLIPQLMTRDSDEFLFVADYLQKLGYDEVNWNLGCPYPMVVNRGMGSGILKSPEIIDSILEKVHAESSIKVSVKMRLGYDNPQEIFKVLPVLEKYPLTHVAIHPRIGKQLYKGEVDLDAFEECIGQCKHTLYYNGDITSVARYRELSERFPGIDHWMIGRGLISDPLLPSMIRENQPGYPGHRVEIFRKFHDVLFLEYEQALSGPSHLLMKMYQFWEYFIQSFPDSPKHLKKIKKSKSISGYKEIVEQILLNAV